MNGRTDERSVEALRRRAERAIEEGRGRRFVEPILERILELAADADPAKLFAHRHLAEMRLEQDPWSAALHLRKVIAAHPHDDVSQSLMALAHALLGNYRAAVAAYRRALQLSPHNPWYHHNLGHLLDVALDQPDAALSHLELALEHADPPEHEITASAAHCLARVGRLDEAAELAEAAVTDAPHNPDHRALLRWIDRGAPRDEPVHPLRTEPREAEPGGGRRRGWDAAVVKLLEQHMREAGFSSRHVERARAMWADYLGERELRVKKPEICAAAVHYAIALVNGVGGCTQASIARRYGVPAKSVSSRYGDIRQTLSLRPKDPRYEAG
ncbi:MAG TPA: tetratricopeptide repeat protein [Sandaracinaceae bacterium LLY-WYZ-13_1]|nr:tetratricopeptide repeat protein [Sandaracinaceae bacterium LLY-WYZ-13_1]